MLFRFGLGSLLGGLLALEAGDEQGAGGVAGDVQSCTAHVEQLVDTGDDGDAFDRQTDLRQDHGQHDHASAGDTGSTDGSERRGQDDHGHVAERQLDTVAAGDEDCADGLIDRGAVHVDRRAEGQDEGADLRLRTHLVAALDVDGERCVGGRGGEGRDHGRGNALEEGEGAHLGEELDGQAVDHDNMDDVADIGNTDDERQLADDVCTIDGNDVGHQAEDTDRGELDDHHHDLHDDFFHAVDELCDFLALLTGGKDARAEEDGDDDDRQHVRGDHRLQQVGREDVHDDLHNGRSFLGFIFQSAEVSRGQRGEVALEEVDEHKADDDGQRGRAHIVHKRLDADGTDALEVLQADDAVSDREQDDRDDQEFQQVDVDRADGLDPLRGKIAETGECEDETGDDTGQHADEYPCRQTELLLFFHAFLLLFFFEDIPQIAFIIP